MKSTDLKKNKEREENNMKILIKFTFQGGFKKELILLVKLKSSHIQEGIGKQEKKVILEKFQTYIELNYTLKINHTVKI